MIGFALVLIAADAPATFPERTPGMIERCLHEAVAAGDVNDEADRIKYICSGEPAAALWDFFEKAGVEAFDQDADGGRWRSRAFPLGGCFKRIAATDGSPAANGLSCTIWIPHDRR